MEASECIGTRMSIRAFKPDPVPRETLMEIVDNARWSPSYKNTQPWEAVILSGVKKEGLSKMLVSLLEADTPPTPDIPEPETWPLVQNERISSLYRKRAEATGIDLADPAIVKKAKRANFNFYRAPHVIYIYQDASLPLWSLFDLGLFAQSLMLAAHARGIGTVPQAFATDYAQQVKEYLGLPRTKRLVIGLSTGYPDPEAPANKLRTDRVPAEEIAAWVE